MTTRRDFFQCLGVGIVASTFADHLRGEEPAPKNTESRPSSAPAKHKRAYELGIASYTLHKYPLDKALEIIKRVGVKEVCLNPIHLPVDSTPEKIAETLEKMKAAGLHLYGSGVVTMRKPEEVNQAFTFAKAAGLQVLVSVPEPEVLALVDEKVKEFDILVAIHNHGPGDKLYPTPSVIIEKIKDLDPRIGLCIDIGHTLRIGSDPIRDAEQYADRLHDVHIKDIHVASADGHGVEVGRGVIDIPKFMRTLDAIGYKGKVSFEYEKDHDDSLPGLAESVGYVRGVMASI